MKVFTSIYFLTNTKVSQQNKIYITIYKLQKKKYTQVTKKQLQNVQQKKSYHENDIVVIVETINKTEKKWEIERKTYNTESKFADVNIIHSAF